MTQIGWYGVDPLMGPVDRLPLAAPGGPGGPGHAPHPSPRARPFGVRLARMPMRIDGAAAQCGEHSKTYTVDKKTKNTKIIVDGTEENHADTFEVEREID